MYCPKHTPAHGRFYARCFIKRLDKIRIEAPQYDVLGQQNCLMHLSELVVENSKMNIKFNKPQNGIAVKNEI